MKARLLRRAWGSIPQKRAQRIAARALVVIPEDANESLTTSNLLSKV